MSEIWDNEILVNVEILNVDSASFTQIKEACGGDEGKIKEMILSIVAERGKMQNPVTGSGGMFIGTVAEVGDKIKERGDLKPGDKIASLVSLSLTPLRIDEILEVRKEIDQVRIKGQAVLFASGIYAKLPNDMPDALALAVLDVCGAPAQVARLVRPGDTVAIIGASGKSGILCAWEAKKRSGVSGKVIGFASSERGFAKLKKVNLCDENRIVNATDALAWRRELEWM
jgi:L-erythro-3,5-diaminohexanoate dehydrogenase